MRRNRQKYKLYFEPQSKAKIPRQTLCRHDRPSVDVDVDEEESQTANETGVGQSDFVVADMVDMFVLLIPPAGGDKLQVVCVSSQIGQDVTELWETMLQFRDVMLSTGTLKFRWQNQQKVWLWNLIQENAVQHFQ
ncbi:methylmalonic aciduria type A homolog, mitochondrial-like [Xyrauchen texanus]|uniref:methylmalonic aciduria type A homolog, mitochondrial-like n=1 Tax=Xyrauchen texanus TaxID=154827 RepID=UPI002241BC65|nr:methylmalonic aciduria type A homolog, mitochondrial-like [Xyrauchen texanus]